jgi:hypothetical protein
MAQDVLEIFIGHFGEEFLDGGADLLVGFLPGWFVEVNTPFGHGTSHSALLVFLGQVGLLDKAAAVIRVSQFLAGIIDYILPEMVTYAVDVV